MEIGLVRNKVEKERYAEEITISDLETAIRIYKGKESHARSNWGRYRR